MWENTEEFVLVGGSGSKLTGHFEMANNFPVRPWLFVFAPSTLGKQNEMNAVNTDD